MNFRILHYKTLDSTNNLALQFAREDAREGTVIITDYQTQGRGRFKRRWLSPRGKGLLFSMILRPKFKVSAAPILTHLAAQSVAEVLKIEFHLPAKLKKPNDILVGGKKIAGVLTESSGNHRHLEYVVVGIGLNVNSTRKDLIRTATSLYLETSKKADMNAILSQILTLFWEKYSKINKAHSGKEGKVLENV